MLLSALADGVEVVDMSASYDKTIEPGTMELAVWTTTHPSWRTTGQNRLLAQSL